jgi:hypothetical protein
MILTGFCRMISDFDAGKKYSVWYKNEKGGLRPL